MTRVETQQPVVVVGLLATPPDQPAEVARKLAVDLGDLLAERVDDRVRWEVRTGWGRRSPAPARRLLVSRRTGRADAGRARRRERPG
ncbi:hypothetical protein [Pseudonocardia sp.]|jgi:hypothetical protein|uniref:hypothetical protein n=1 Tax=Pseudonocardia sp. TaxID=60912 RepID=UPI0031FBFFD5